MPQTTAAPVDAGARIRDARVLLVEVEPHQNALSTLAAAAVAATAAVLMAGVMVLGPGIALDETPAVMDSDAGF